MLFFSKGKFWRNHASKTKVCILFILCIYSVILGSEVLTLDLCSWRHMRHSSGLEMGSAPHAAPQCSSCPLCSLCSPAGLPVLSLVPHCGAPLAPPLCCSPLQGSPVVVYVLPPPPLQGFLVVGCVPPAVVLPDSTPCALGCLSVCTPICLSLLVIAESLCCFDLHTALVPQT